MSIKRSVTTSLLILVVILIQYTPIHRASKTTFSDVMRCCTTAGLSEYCANNLCRPVANLTYFQNDDGYYLARRCSLTDFSRAAACLSDGRNHSACCHSQAPYTEQAMLCVHLCSGEPLTIDVSQELTDASKEYTNCLLLNFQSAMLRCIARGYDTIPGPPLDVRAEQVGDRQAILSWMAPRKLPETVESYVLRYYYDSTDSDSGLDWQEVRMASTTKTRLGINSLRPNRHYSFHVVSVGGQGESLKSEVGHFITGASAPLVEAYQKRLTVPLNGSATLVCQVKVDGVVMRPIRGEWSRSLTQNRFEILPTNPRKFELNFFSPQHNPDRRQQPSTEYLYLSTLYIKNLSSGDYATYKCHAISESGSAAETIQLVQPNAADPPDAPPDLSQCCLQQGVSSQCASLCNNDPQEALSIPQLKHPTCTDQMPKISRCLLGIGNSATGACCLRRRVPSHCLDVCQNGVAGLLAGTRPNFASCSQFLSQIFDCVVEGQSGAPSPPGRLVFSKIKQATALGGTLSWEKSLTADSYHIYYRRIRPTLSPTWIRLHTTSIRANLSNLKRDALYKAVVLAANSFGFSDSSRSLEISV